MVALTDCDPQPSFGERGTILTSPYEVPKPYWNFAVVAIPHGFTVPCRVAVVPATVALPVVTTGI